MCECCSRIVPTTQTHSACLHACILTTRLKKAKTGNVTVARLEVIRGLTAEHFMHFECWLKVCRIPATNRTAYRIWARRGTNQLWFVDEEFAVTACSVWCRSVLLKSELNLFLCLPTAHFLQPLLLSLWPPDQLLYLFYCLSLLPHTVPYVMSQMDYISLQRLQK